MTSFKLKRHLHGDRQIWFILVLLSVISILVVYSSVSALAYRKTDGNTEFFLLKHSFFLGLGLFVTYVIHRFDFTQYSGLATIFLWITPFLIIYTLLFGVSVGGARRWVSILGLSFQTSDFVRLVLITNLSAMLARRQHVEYKASDLWYMITWIGLTVGLLSISSFSTSVILGITCFLIMWIGRVPKRFLFRMVAVVVMGVVGVLALGLIAKRGANIEIGRVQTVIDRMESFVNHDLDGDGLTGGEHGSLSDQKNYALIAIAKGGVFGIGPGNSSQKNILPDAFSDFIYSIIIEEYGLIGGMAVMLLYLWLLYRGVFNIEFTTRAFSGLLSVGLTLSIVLQAFAHMFINVGLGPVTGQTLPLISMGGTSALFTSVAIGIVLSVTKNHNPEKNEKTA
ncbi:MAG: FtsW/RodA/SpoVE family cell cycle protein [Cytophagaceae bacterium]|nr:FtsW/RodA/SpoVE family cell cycle protein [Cytophagaceae bacterium]MBK9508813.1 FtsW/RodA/SpoVE family cell cycle protein [Cytophagaceae bacterium]MBL0302159.1 FtsW/RodA/SpoVE family cell cycle protein [Cytophagaceae bacterium]MBL0324979.1 FtsW/RodA/SpoVE family cell cycle protein [Cytophagaceae bacterium]